MTQETDDESRSSEPAPDLDEALDEIQQADRSAKIQAVAIGVGVLVVFAGFFGWLIYRTDDLSEELFRPDIDVEEGEQLLLEDTGDPTCRNLLGEVRELWGEFLDLEFDYEDYIWGDDPDELERLREESAQFRARFEELREDIDRAVWRDEEIPGHPPVEEQLEQWFDNMDNEFRILEEMAERRLRKLGDEEVEQRGGMWTDPPYLRDTVLMNTGENFEEFRVWVIRGGHPCGPPPEGVDSWEPSEGEDIEGMSRPR